MSVGTYRSISGRLWDADHVGGFLSAPYGDVPFPVRAECGARTPGAAWQPMSDHDPAVASNGAARNPVRELQNLMLATDVVESFLQELVEFAVAAIGGEVSASVTVSRHGHPATVASSDARAAKFDEVQYHHDGGPCLTAMRTGEVVQTGDLALDERFRQYRPHALALGVRSSLSLPLDGGGSVVGALNVYSGRTHGFSPSEQADARRFADEASLALNLAVRLADHVEITEQLRASLSLRTTIDQTIGIIMFQKMCDADAAMAVLRTASLNRDVTLLVVAAEIVTAVSKTVPIDRQPSQN